MIVTIDMAGLIVICGFFFCMQAVLTLGWMLSRMQFSFERQQRIQFERQLYTYKRLPFHEPTSQPTTTYTIRPNLLPLPSRSEGWGRFERIRTWLNQPVF